MLSLSHGLLSPHEALTLARHYGERCYPLLTTLVWVVQDTLQQLNYTDFPKLLAALRVEDPGEEGFITRDMLRHTCKRAGLPLTDQLVDGILMK